MSGVTINPACGTLVLELEDQDADTEFKDIGGSMASVSALSSDGLMTGVDLAIDTINAEATTGTFPVTVKCYFSNYPSFAMEELEVNVEIIQCQDYL